MTMMMKNNQQVTPTAELLLPWAVMELGPNEVEALETFFKEETNLRKYGTRKPRDQQKTEEMKKKCVSHYCCC